MSRFYKRHPIAGYNKKEKENIKKLDLSKELEVEILSIDWGRSGSSNIFMHCKDCKTGIEFFFSVFYENGYKSRSEDFDFREYKEEGMLGINNKIIATFKLSRNGYLNCISARLA